MSGIAITALLSPVAIVHIPIHLAPSLTTKIYWTIDRASIDSEEFFNLTSNRIEIAIFASLDLVLQEWASTSEVGVDVDGSGSGSGVLISSTWRVFEISSGDEGDVGNYDSPHLRHVSAPLARAGISILYQSSYFTDFLLVKESDFDRTAAIFAEQGWRIDPTSTCPTPSTPTNQRHSQLLSPLSPSTPTHPSSTMSTASPSASAIRSSPPPPAQPEVTVLPSALACVGFSRTAEQRSRERVLKFLVWPERILSSSSSNIPYDEVEEGGMTEAESESEVSEVIANEETQGQRERPFISYTRNEDGSSLMTELSVLRSLFPPGQEEELELQSGGELNCYSGGVGGGCASRSSTYAYSDTDTDTDDEVGWTNGQMRTPPPEDSLPTPISNCGGNDLSGGGDEDEEEIVAIPIKWAGPGHLNPHNNNSIGKSKRQRRKEEEGKGTKKCLQLDLRGIGDGHDEGEAYHLEKSGLVCRFSNLLTSSGNEGPTSKSIRILYSSTFHTANILVESKDVKRAKKLLERKRRSGEWSTHAQS